MKKVQSKIVWKRVTLENSHSTNLHVHRSNNMMLMRYDAVEMSLNGTEYSCWATAWASYRIVHSPAVCLRYLSSASVTVYSLIPISNFSKCASITCWTKTQINTVIYWRENRRGNNSSLSTDSVSPDGTFFCHFHLLVKNRKMPKICCVVGGTINRLKTKDSVFVIHSAFTDKSGYRQ